MKEQKEKKERQTWIGYYPRRTKTKREKEISRERKHKKDYKREVE